MAVSNENDASTVGCLLVVSGVGIGLAIFLALTQKEPAWFWLMVLGALVQWGVFSIHKEAIKPIDKIKLELAAARLRIERIDEEKKNLELALLAFRERGRSEGRALSLYKLELEKLDSSKKEIDREKSDLLNQKEFARRELVELEAKRREHEIRMKEIRQQVETELSEMWQKCWDEKSSGFPMLAAKSADAWMAVWENDVSALRRRAPVAAIDLKRKLSKEIRGLKESEAIHRSLVEYYESLFPWIEEFRGESSPADLVGEETTDEGFRPLWIQASEWQNLSEVQRSQLALDRYIERKKSKWEIGIEYERFCGYELEKKGWKVEYHGAIRGIDDLGRDLLARKPGRVLVVQCKNWSQHKEIHEKHVFQTYGTMVAMRIEEPESEILGWLATSTRLSARAKKFADALGLKVNESLKIGPFPRIKCHGESGIYHLPFDQQYDAIVMRPERRDIYCHTAEEAESKGFRRAMIWRG